MEPSKHQPSDKNRNADSGSNFGDNPWRAMGLIGTVGAALAACLGLGYWLGSKADAQSGGMMYSIVGMLVGLAAGIVTVFFLIRKYTGGKRS